MNFVSIDVETANADFASICQIGLVQYEGGEWVREWESLVDPKDEFSGYNIGIHGITPEAVAEAPSFAELHEELRSWLENQIVVCHSPFDRTALQRAAEKCGLKQIDCRWVDSACVARRTWEHCRNSGSGLSALCEFLNYEFKHHDALEDAKAAAHVMIAAISESNVSIEQWVSEAKRPIDKAAPGAARTKKVEPNPDGPFYGSVLLFTGTLSFPRNEAKILAAEVGFKITSSVSGSTTHLVVGDQDLSKLAGHDKSKKHREAEERQAKGQDIRIIGESDFRELTKVAATTGEEA